MSHALTELKAALQRAVCAEPDSAWKARLAYVTGAYGVEMHAIRPGFAPQVFSTRYLLPMTAEAFAAWLQACLAELANFGDDPSQAAKAARRRSTRPDAEAVRPPLVIRPARRR
ncbi:hypothetical protein ACFP2F_21520 [Hymenobacter artigasi]|uniref:Uncharacterized protein n=1 Tax=Hymenobacter artigasi TaxID=2719616 RepID=A0ABX1HNL4_9BACT|nr:hypothetical protein [Hymenobacter artigasi]NKI91849.1 hypothetical protein [Hymenobacter artigasi]